jgi:hypothetical protein
MEWLLVAALFAGLWVAAMWMLLKTLDRYK